MKTININGKDFTIEELNKLIEDAERSIYPIYCQHLHSGKIVKFTGLKQGTLVKNDSDSAQLVGSVSNNWVDHDSALDWKLIPVCPVTGFFHGQLVWAWDNEHTHFRVISFYDAKNSCSFSIHGKKRSLAYDNYLPFEGNWPNWALEAYKTLEL